MLEATKCTAVSNKIMKPTEPVLYKCFANQNTVTHTARMQQITSGLRTAETEVDTTVLISLWICQEKVRIYFHCTINSSSIEHLEPKRGSTAERSHCNVASVSVIHASACSYSSFQMFVGKTYIDRGRTVPYFEVGTR
jgi:hypothetical protein